jgi:hypothetical protein
MKSHLSTLVLLLIGTLASSVICADEPKVPAGPYSTDFSKYKPGKPPEEFYLLNTQADFKIAEDAGNKFLELAGNPLDSFGVLYGPEGLVGGELTAKIYGTTEGKLFPEFGLGVNDSGWKVWLIPGQNALVVRKRDDEKVRVPYTAWKSGRWTNFRMKLSKTADGKWTIQGKAWPADGKEPADWMISTTDDKAPSAGRATIWGTPYAGTPIRFDDLSVTPEK